MRRLCPRFRGFLVHQHDRPSRPGIAGRAPVVAVVLCDALLHVRADAGVERAVRTMHNVDGPGFLWLWHGFDFGFLGNFTRKCNLMCSQAYRLQKLAEFFNRESCISNDPAHCVCINWLCRGMVRMRTSSVMTRCFPWRAIRKPAFCKARTAS